MTSVRVVLGTDAWCEWLLPFLDDPRFAVELAPPSLAPAEAVLFLSHHATLRRDGTFAGPLRDLGVPIVVCQPPAVVDLALDKCLMAARAAQVDGLHPIPELTPAEGQRLLAARKARMVVAKPRDGTEGQGMFFFERAEDLSTTGVRLYEGGYVLQPFVAGDEFSVNMVWNAGRCNVYPPVAKGRAGEAHPIFRTRHCPAELPAALLNACLEYMRPFDPSGPVEVELIRRGEEYYLLDVNPRLSATLRLTAVAAESNPFTDLIADALGLAPLGRIVGPRRHALEWPLHRALDDDERAELARRKDLWISTRITLAAPDPRALQDRADELRWLLEH